MGCKSSIQHLISNFVQVIKAYSELLKLPHPINYYYYLDNKVKRTMARQLSSKTRTFGKVRLLLWKNYLVQKRHWIQTIIDVMLPVVLIGFVVCFGFPNILDNRWNSKLSISWEINVDINQNSEFIYPINCKL